MDAAARLSCRARAGSAAAALRGGQRGDERGVLRVGLPGGVAKGIDPARLGRLLSFGHALAQVALADGTVDALEREAMINALRGRRIFSGSELELVVDLALAQANAWKELDGDNADRAALEQAAEAVAMADNVITDQERAAIRELLASSRRR